MSERWQQAYRIFEVGATNPQTLFHGWHGSRTLPLNRELKAQQRVVTNPGKAGGPTFRAGWHVTLSKADAEKYLGNFSSGRHLIVCRVLVRDFRPKPRSPHPVYLAKAMKVQQRDWTAALLDWNETL